MVSRVKGIRVKEICRFVVILVSALVATSFQLQGFAVAQAESSPSETKASLLNQQVQTARDLYQKILSRSPEGFYAIEELRKMVEDFQQKNFQHVGFQETAFQQRNFAGEKQKVSANATDQALKELLDIDLFLLASGIYLNRLANIAEYLAINAYGMPALFRQLGFVDDEQYVKKARVFSAKRASSAIKIIVDEKLLPRNLQNDSCRVQINSRSKLFSFNETLFLSQNVSVFVSVYCDKGLTLFSWLQVWPASGVTVIQLDRANAKFVTLNQRSDLLQEPTEIRRDTPNARDYLFGIRAYFHQHLIGTKKQKFRNMEFADGKFVSCGLYWAGPWAAIEFEGAQLFSSRKVLARGVSRSSRYDLYRLGVAKTFFPPDYAESLAQADPVLLKESDPTRPFLTAGLGVSHYLCRFGNCTAQRWDAQLRYAGIFGVGLRNNFGAARKFGVDVDLRLRPEVARGGFFIQAELGLGFLGTF